MRIVIKMLTSGVKIEYKLMDEGDGAVRYFAE